jgi:photosynthetic reaction center H subunit
MHTGAITQYIDVAQLVLYAFWIFFAGLIFYLHRENKREGYPLEQEDTRGRVVVQGFPAVPSPKSYLMRNGDVVLLPNPNNPEQPDTRLPGTRPGDPIDPVGNPLLAGVGPGSWANRPDVPDLTYDDHPRIVPLRVAKLLGVDIKDTDPRGLQVVGTDGKVAGIVIDLWVDQAEHIFRYIEVQLAEPAGARPVLLPMGFARVKRSHVQVDSITGFQFRDVPLTRAADRITMLEEEKVMAYFGAGTLYATAERSEPLI